MAKRPRDPHYYRHLCNPCDGCGQLPVNNVAPQSHKNRWQCPYYAARDRDKLTEDCWGMFTEMSGDLESVKAWNMGDEKYREAMGMVPKPKKSGS